MIDLRGWPCPDCGQPMEKWGCRPCNEPERERHLADVLTLLDTECVRRLVEDARMLGDPCHGRNLIVCVKQHLAERRGVCRCGRPLDNRLCSTCRVCLELETVNG